MASELSPSRDAGLSEASERNKDPILEVLRETFSACSAVLEIGSGTGQHALHFSRNLPDLSWQPSDICECLHGLARRLAASAPPNVGAPIELDVRMRPWPVGTYDGIFTANSLHIMSWHCVEHFFRGVGEVLGDPGTLCVYGPFRYSGQYTSDSNERFDHFLRSRDPDSGIRDFESLNHLAMLAGLRFVQDVSMPANNQLLVWRR